MSEPNTIVETENLPTVVTVTFVLALLAVGFNFYTFSRLNEVAAILSAVDVGLNNRNVKTMQDLDKRIVALEAEIATLKAAKAAPAPAPAPE